MDTVEKGIVVAEQGGALQTDVLDMGALEQFAGQGSDNVGAADLQTQFVSIIESNSAALKPNNGGYVKGATQGMILKSVTRSVIEGTVGFFAIPCYYSKECVEWSPANRIVARHSLTSEEYMQAAKEDLRNEQRRLINRASNSMTDTRYHALLLVDPVTLRTERAVVSMSTTRIKASNRLNKQILDCVVKNSANKDFTPPRFGQLYHFTVVGENDGKGHDYYNWSTKFISAVGSKAIFAEAKAYYEECLAQGAVLSGNAALAEDSQDSLPGTPHAGNDGRGADVPF